MNALLFIQDKRKAMEKIEFVSMVRLATGGSKKAIEKAMEQWARQADIMLTFED